MFFNYYEYCQVNLVRPLLHILVGTGGLVTCTFPQIAALISDPQEYLYLISPIVGGGSILMAFICSGGYPFWAGGYHLLREKPKDVICIRGKIESIRECSPFQFFNYKTANGHAQGYRITVNGVAYLAMDNARCIAGNDVVITVLPRSKLILSIMKLDAEEETP